LEDFKEKEQLNHLSLRPLLDLLLTEAQEEEKAQIWSLIQDHFSVQ
jgi:predicted glycosyltransferase